MAMFAIKHPAATIARAIENMILTGENSENKIIQTGCALLSRAISVTVFPIFLTAELFFKRIPKTVFSLPNFLASEGRSNSTKFHRNIEKIEKFALSILFSPLGMRSPDAVSCFFLKNEPSDNSVKPFGVERIYGKEVSKICYPKSINELQTIVMNAKRKGQQISIIGAGMSQGEQTIPSNGKKHLVIHTKHLNTIEVDSRNNLVKVGSGATWEQIQIALNKEGKSAIVKQASDLFSVGGSIGINCHGWAHEYGSIASTVESMRVINAEGELLHLTKEDELFGCMFGTLGYFGVVVDVTLKITDNEHLIEKSEKVSIDDFDRVYQEKIKGKDIPLFGGRLCLDSLGGNPLRAVEMNCFKKDKEKNLKQGNVPLVSKNFTKEGKLGTRLERISLQALAHLTYFTASRILSRFWESQSKQMHLKRKITRNEALHPPINAFMMLHHSNLHAQWLQEYFIKKENLPKFLRYLGAELKANSVKLINATIRPTPKDEISILPYANEDRYAVVICFDQLKTNKEIEKTKNWITAVNQTVIDNGDIYYQAYMPYTTQEQFEKCYGKETIENMRGLKQKYDPNNLFGNAHTAKYFDKK